jgi:hypothetical protein
MQPNRSFILFRDMLYLFSLKWKKTASIALATQFRASAMLLYRFQEIMNSGIGMSSNAGIFVHFEEKKKIYIWNGNDVKF